MAGILRSSESVAARDGHTPTLLIAGSLERYLSSTHPWYPGCGWRDLAEQLGQHSFNQQILTVHPLHADSGGQSE